MKKYIFLVLFLGIVYHMNSQYVDRSFFKAGFHAGFAVGDASDFANIGAGLDLYQHWGVSKKFDLGLASGLMYYFGLDSTIDIGPEAITIRGEDTIYLPAGALIRFYPTKGFNLGADVGYALGLNSFSDSGLYFRPTLAINLSNTSALNFSYFGVEGDNLNWTALTAGVLFQF